jgi:hypothetical protein
VIVSIHQPGYLPWHGLFHRLALSDTHIFFDSTQFEKNGFNNRVKVKTPQGVKWLTVPVLTKGRFGHNPISSIPINNAVDWSDIHRKTLLYNYSRAPFWKAHHEFFFEVFSRTWNLLGDLNIFTVEYLARALGVRCQFVKASQLGPLGTKAELVVNLCKAVGASTYISGINGRQYLDAAGFEREGISLRFQAYREPRYTQLHGEFQPFMSIVDLLFNHGPSSLEIVLNGQDGLENGTTA